MIEPVITDQAQADLDEAWDYLSDRSAAAADRLIDGFTAAARIHAQFPESGRERRDIGPGLRSFLVKPYVVFYRPVQGSIEVLRVIHGHRDPEGIIALSGSPGQ